MQQNRMSELLRFWLVSCAVQYDRYHQAGEARVAAVASSLVVGAEIEILDVVLSFVVVGMLVA